jgi:hypothetical protein
VRQFSRAPFRNYTPFSLLYCPPAKGRSPEHG